MDGGRRSESLLAQRSESRLGTRPAIEFVLWAQSSEPLRIIFRSSTLGYRSPSACSWRLDDLLQLLRQDSHARALLNSVPWRREAVLWVAAAALLIGAAQRLTSGKATGIDLWQEQDLGGNTPRPQSQRGSEGST